VLNGLLLAVAAYDRSWVAIGIDEGFGPIANGLLLLFGLCYIPSLKRRARGIPVLPYVAAAIALPVSAVFVDDAAIRGPDTGTQRLCLNPPKFGACSVAHHRFVE
jgi:hypothetical protein